MFYKLSDISFFVRSGHLNNDSNQYGGLIDGGKIIATGVWGFYWASTAAHEIYGYNFHEEPDFAQPSRTDWKSWPFPLRCLAI